MRRLAVLVPALFLAPLCGNAAELNEERAREAMYKDRGFSTFSNLCAAAAIDESKKAACEQETQERKAAFRFELVTCEPGVPENLKALLGPLNDPKTCVVRWSKDLEQTAPLRSSEVLFHVVDGRLEADMIGPAK